MFLRTGQDCLYPANSQLVALLQDGDRLKAAVIDDLTNSKPPCSEKTAERAVNKALGLKMVFQYDDDKKPVRGGSRPKWLTLKEPEAGGQVSP